MAEHVLERKQLIDLPLDETFQFFADAENLEKITPPELNFKIVTERPIEIREGTLIDYNLKLRGIAINWRTEISLWDPPFAFVDQALKSPYSQWIHLHEFRQLENGKTEMTDRVKYRLPLEPLGDLMHWYVRRELDYIFDFRRDVVEKLLSASNRNIEQKNASPEAVGS